MEVPVVTLGKDDEVLRRLDCYVDDNLRGFRVLGFSDADEQSFMHLAQETMFELWDDVPEAIRRYVPREISFYSTQTKFGGRHITQNNIENEPDVYAFVSYTNDKSKATIEKVSAGGTVRVLRWPRARINYVATSFLPQVLLKHSDFLREHLVHEFIHVCTHPGLSVAPIFSEAFAEALSKKYRKPRKDTEIGYLPWRPSEFKGTCGFRTEDFADFPRTEGSGTAMRIISMNALSHLPDELLWGACGDLVTKAYESGFCPASIDVFSAFKKYFGAKETSLLLESVAFRPMQPGKQSFVFPFAGNYAYAYTFKIEKNVEYLKLHSEEPQWDNNQFFIQDVPSSISVQAETKCGIFEFDDEIETNDVRSFHRTASLLEERTKSAVKSEELLEVHCRVGKLGFVLQSTDFRL